ncbi:MAG: hypothetical protein ACP5C3_08995 [Methanomicrobiales archaeon]
MSNLKVSMGIFTKEGVMVENPELFNEKEFVVVLSGDSFLEYLEKTQEDFTIKDNVLESKEFTDAEHY